MLRRKPIIVLMTLLVFTVSVPIADNGTETEMSVSEIEKKQEEILQKMLNISPTNQPSPTQTNAEIIAAFETASKNIREADRIMEKIDDAYTSGNFELAESLINAAKRENLTQAQSDRCDEYLAAISKERQFKAYTLSSGSLNEQLNPNPPNQVYGKSVFTTIVESPWTWVAVGGIAVGTATYLYLNQEPETRYTVPVHIHW
jgi:hypothetical protein